MVNVFSKLYVTFILQWVVFIFGRDKEEDQLVCHMQERQLSLLPASVAQLDASSDWRPGGCRFTSCRGQQHSFVEIDHEIFSTVILSLPLIQEGQLSVSGERMCLSEVLLMSTHNICFHGEIRKVLCGYPLLSGAMHDLDIL